MRHGCNADKKDWFVVNFDVFGGLSLDEWLEGDERKQKNKKKRHLWHHQSAQSTQNGCQMFTVPSEKHLTKRQFFNRYKR